MRRNTPLVLGILTAAGSLFSQRPAPRQGISVQMPIAPRASEMSAADEPNATILTITAAGKVFLGVTSAEISALGALTPGTIYVKADARTPYQPLLAVLDALHGKTVVLLSASPADGAKRGYLPPFGTALRVAR